MALRATGLAAVWALARGVKLIDLEEGSLFTKCIKISDLHEKTMEDDIELFDRDEVTGCCPGATEPGVKFELKWKSESYVGPQIACGFMANGEIKYEIVRDSNSGLQKCNFNNCFVMKSNLECRNGGRKQRINGCCGGPYRYCYKDSCGFKDNCNNYIHDKNALNISNPRVRYCTTYHKGWKARGSEGTPLEEDDVDTSRATAKLLTNNLHVYARCEGAFPNRTGEGGGSGETSPTTQSTQPSLEVAVEPLASKVADCGSPMTPAFTAGRQCTGCAQGLVDLNSVNTLGTEAGCLAAVMGASSQLEGHPCVTIRKSGDKVVECNMHTSCGTEKATTNDIQSCLFQAQADCPAQDVSCRDSPSVLLSSGKRAGTGIVYVVAVGTVIVLMR
eukprot:TRINITY_DN8297_c0_g1_i1.p1 TRINITY_DN8297_c0_g1~~TRINITY_DN8297_c0_g1_i1.p1  ORF type:complete len:389 (-),score=55.92 TRINITY_DN8297_c0_g1_i1:286-1452(-)